MAPEGKVEKLIDVDSAATILGLAPGTVRNKANEGEIPSVKLGAGRNAPLRFRESELDEWIKQKQKEAEGTT